MSQPTRPIIAAIPDKSADVPSQPRLQFDRAASEFDRPLKGLIRDNNPVPIPRSSRESNRPFLGFPDKKFQPDFVATLAALLGTISFGVLLASRHIADGDLWAKRALGAHVWNFGTLPHRNVFAFTPVLPEYVDHEWGAGTIFFGLLKFFGPASLMWLKLILAFGTMAVALFTGRRGGSHWASLLVLAIPASACVVLGFVPVIRSHTFTYCLFALTLLCLEEIMRHGTISSPESFRSRRASMMLPASVIVGTMLIWVNVHGGFVAGLGTIGIY